jgi:ATP/maltotriose-dependent transcriptional regulator MalT
VHAFATASYVRSAVRYFSGRVTDSLTDVREALDARRHGWRMYEIPATSILVRGLVEQGGLDEALAMVLEQRDAFDPPGPMTAMLLLARAEVCRAMGDLEGALADYRRAQDANGAVVAPLWIPWREGAVPVLVQLGRHAEAAAVADDMESVCQRVDEVGHIGRALWLRGLVEPGPRGVELLQQAVDHLRRSEPTLALLHAQVDAGAALRRLGRNREARPFLAEAIDAGHRVGAVAVVARAQAEMRVAGGRPRRIAVTGVDALTPQERRVAEMAASGSSNRDIAQALFVTPKAIEGHLGNVFAKLHVGSRRDLPHALEEAI